ncbi:uncharacterized protein YeaO (DUF488 family) [Salegentibacter sp. 24]|uniref:DUF488 domain-containing protein n=1 Tax=Salegentibacter sp. 24 TaxID=2183986 RepID=UPI00105F6E47|nr:DUF488 family protein [Salegentibacter sp. 24]TDN94952.1 uncharacterized protein YeaO (DUF488 family) [Salegentibacter sp. 24]
MNIETARIYENKEASDKLRILVDKLWPRGISKEEALLDHWYKQWAPSDDLRKQFHQDKISWEEFQKEYKQELKDNKDQILNDLDDLDKRKTLLLLYGSKDKTNNHAVLLKDFLRDLN